MDTIDNEEVVPGTCAGGCSGVVDGNEAPELEDMDQDDDDLGDDGSFDEDEDDADDSDA